MNAPSYYLVAGNDAFALDEDTGIVYGCFVDDNGTIDWDCAYDFDPDDDDVEYIAHMSKLVLDMAALHLEQQNNMEAFVK